MYTHDIAVQAHRLTKRYGEVTAVDSLTFSLRPGVVTGFLGPNGAGKSTTLRMMLGLDKPSAGIATFGGLRMSELPEPMRVVGSLLDARAVHPGRSGFDHVLAVAQAGGIARERVDEVLDQVGLAEASRRVAGGYSLGMHQRLGIAAALVGNPAVLIFDEPLNGLDPEGIRWARALMRDLAAEGRTVLFSSHLMAEMELTADHLLVIHHGKLLVDASLADVIATHADRRVVVRSPRRDALLRVLADADLEFIDDGLDSFDVLGATPEAVGRLAATAGVELSHLTDGRDSLERIFLSMTLAAPGQEGQNR